jgi:hypothetical protein
MRGNMKTRARVSTMASKLDRIKVLRVFPLASGLLVAGVMIRQGVAASREAAADILFFLDFLNAVKTLPHL